MRRPVTRKASQYFQKAWLRLRQTALVLTPLILIVGLIQSSYTHIQNINCQLDGQECSLTANQTLAEYKGRSLFSLKIQALIKKLELDPLVETATVQVVFPNRLEVHLEQPKNLLTVGVLEPATTSAQIPEITREAELLNQPPQSFYLLTPRGILIKNDKTEFRALIWKEKNLPDTKTLANFHKLYWETITGGLNIDKLWLTNRWVGAKLKTNTLVIFDKTADPLQAVTTLQQILAQATMDLTHAVIDLRFNKPVITINP